MLHTSNINQQHKQQKNNHWDRYPCFDEEVTYGLAVMGLDVKGNENTTLLHVSLTVGITYEPNVRDGEEPIPINGDIEVNNEFNEFNQNPSYLSFFWSIHISSGCVVSVLLSVLL